MEIKDLLGDSYKDGMTMEELTEALKNIEMPKDQTSEIEKLKETISKSNSEAAEWKNKYRSTLDDATKKAQEAEEEAKRKDELLEQLQREKVIASYKASYLAMGYDAELAEDTAKALAEGDDKKLFENQRKHQESVEKKAREDALRTSGRPGGNGNGSGNNEDSEAIKIAKEIGANQKQANDIAKAGLEYYLK